MTSPYPRKPSSWRGIIAGNDNTSTFNKVLRAHIAEATLDLRDPMDRSYWISVGFIAVVLLLLALIFFFV